MYSVYIPYAKTPILPKPPNFNEQDVKLPVILGRTGKPKRNRTAFSVKQLDELENIYKVTPFVKRLRRADIAKMLNLPERQVKIWFQNRRMKEKREKSTPSQSVSSKTTTPSRSPQSYDSGLHTNDHRIRDNLLQYQNLNIEPHGPVDQPVDQHDSHAMPIDQKMTNTFKENSIVQKPEYMNSDFIEAEKRLANHYGFVAIDCEHSNRQDELYTSNQLIDIESNQNNLFYTGFIDSFYDPLVLSNDVSHGWSLCPPNEIQEPTLLNL